VLKCSSRLNSGRLMWTTGNGQWREVKTRGGFVSVVSPPGWGSLPAAGGVLLRMALTICIRAYLSPLLRLYPQLSTCLCSSFLFFHSLFPIFFVSSPPPPPSPPFSSPYLYLVCLAPFFSFFLSLRPTPRPFPFFFLVVREWREEERGRELKSICVCNFVVMLMLIFVVVSPSLSYFFFFSPLLFFSFSLSLLFFSPSFIFTRFCCL